MCMCNRIRCPKCHEKMSYFAYKCHINPLYCKPPQDPDVTVELQNEGNVRDTRSAEIADQLNSHEEDVAYEWNIMMKK